MAERSIAGHDRGPGVRWFRRRTVNNRAGAMPGVSNPGVQSLFEFGVARGLGASKRAISEIMSRVIGAERGDTVKPRPAFLSHAVPKSSISSTSRITGFPGGSRRRATPPPRSRRRNCPAARRTASTSIISCESTSWRAAVPGRDRGSVIPSWRKQDLAGRLGKRSTGMWTGGRTGSGKSSSQQT